MSRSGTLLIPFALYVVFVILAKTPEASLTGRISPASSSSQNSTMTNAIMRTRSGEIYLLNEGRLLKMERPEGDIWQTIATDLKAAALDPADEKVIYTTNGSGISKSVDGGKRWISLRNGLPQNGINFISINPTNTTEVFAGTDIGLYATADSGFSWTPTTLKTPVHQLYVDSKLSKNRYALTDGSIIVSNDGGLNWQRSEAGLPTDVIRAQGKPPRRVIAKVRSLFFIDRERPYLLADTVGHGMYRSDDQAASWKEANTGLNVSDQYESVSVDDSEVVIAGSNIARSNDGAEWKIFPVKSNRYSVGGFSGVTRHPSADGYVILFHNFQNSPRTERIGFVNYAGTVIGLSYGLLPCSNVNAIWSGKVNNFGALFATISNRIGGEGNYSVVEEGTYLSLDDGLSWDYLFSSNCGNFTANRPASADIWMFGGNACLLRTLDGGLTWVRAANAAFAYANDSVSKIAFDSADKTLLYYTAGVNEHVLYRYKYNPVRNEGQVVSLNVAAADVSVREDDPKMIYTDTGQFTSDGGWTWLDKAGALAKYVNLRRYGKGYRRDDMTLLSFRGNEIRVALYAYDSYMHSGGAAILGSSDLGDSWQVVSAFEGQELQRIFVDPEDSRDMFAVIRTFVRQQFSTKGDTIKVLETKDGGSTWQERYSYKLTESDRMYYHERDIVQTVTQSKTGIARSLLVGGWIGLWKSRDEGKTWTRLGGVPISESGR